MADETLVIEIAADVTGLEPTILLLEKLGKIDAATAEQFRKATTAFQAQDKALKATNTTLKETGAQVEKSGKQISETAKKTSSDLGNLSNSIKGVGAAIGIGLSVGAIVAFGKESFKAFTDAEKTAKVLQTAVSVNGGLARDFEILIEQSKELQKTTIFSDDNIQKVQTMALQFGLTTKQVQNLLPVITDFASATGQTLEGALEAVLRGSEGMARGLKIYGIQVQDAGSKSDKLKDIVQQLTDKFAGQAEVVGKTTFGATERLKNSFNDLQEEIGGFVADVAGSTLGLVDWVLRGFKPVNESLDEMGIKLDEVGKKIGDNLGEAVLHQQIENLKALGQAVPTELTDRLNKIEFNKFIDSLEKLTDKQLVDKLKELQATAEKFDDLSIADKSFAPSGKTKEQIDAINQLIKARKIQSELLDDQNKVDIKSTREAQLKELEERRKAQEALRKFIFDELNKNADIEASNRKLIAEQTIQDDKQLQLAQLDIDVDTLKQKKQNGIDTIQDTADIDAQLIGLAQKRVALLKEINKTGGEIHPNKEDYDNALKESKDFTDKLKEQRERNLQEALQTFGSIANEISQIFINADQAAIDSLNARKEASQEAFDADSQALQDKLDRDQISQAEYDLQLKALRQKEADDKKRLDAEARKLKNEQAQREKQFAVFQVLANSPAAIIKAFAENFFLGLLMTTLAGLQLANALSVPVPKFHKGKLAKTDSSEEHAIIRRDETILSPENSKNYRKTLEAIHNNKIPAKVLNDFVQLRLNSPNFSHTATKEISESGLDEYGVARALKSGTNIKNTDALAKAIARELHSDSNPYHR